MLLVRGQVQYHIGGWNQLFRRADLKTIFRCAFPGLPLLFDRCFTQCIGYIQTAISKVQTLVKALGSTADDHQFFA